MKPFALLSIPLLAVALASGACDPSTRATPPPSTSAAAPPPAVPPEPGLDPAPPPPSITPLAKPATTDELRALAKSDNAFAVDFYARARARNGTGNLVFSPFSISTALAMTLAGARGDTAAQMAKVLHLDGPTDRAVDVAGSLVAAYAAPDQKVTVRVANRLFGDKTYTFEPPFLARLQRAFGAPLEPLDFKGATEASRQRINGWVAGETHDRIRDLVPATGVTADTRLALVNAVYFLGDWASPFDRPATSDAAFFTARATPKSVPTMHQNGHFRFAALDGVHVLELPYDSGALAMSFVLPDAVDGLGAVEARLTPALLEHWLGVGSSYSVDVALPKLQIAPDALSLGDTLSAMGMPLALTRGQADLTGIANPASPADRLFIAKVFHKAFVKVDEKGTEAAAATAVMGALAGAAPVQEQPKEFKADHPFLFFLRDLRSGLILFMGRVTDPSARS